MRYLIRLNPRVLNPLTGRVDAKHLWEVEQCEKIGGNGRTDSPAIIWRCANVKIDGKPVDQLAPLEAYRALAKPQAIGEKRWQLEVWGICSRGADDAIEIRITTREVSGN
jgi:hypothetical protein